MKPLTPVIQTGPTLPLKGPLLISTVYLKTVIDTNTLKRAQIIESSFDLKGKSEFRMDGEYRYFPAPLSYPYEYTEEGIRHLEQRLQQVSAVDRPSIHVAHFPSVPMNEQTAYPELKDISYEEKYIAFGLKNLPQVMVMVFPTFIVVNMDFTQGSPVSAEEYRQSCDAWKSMIQQFNEMEELKKVLDITRIKTARKQSPLLVLIALDAYHSDVNFVNRYTMGAGDAAQKRALFLNEVSLLGPPQGFRKDALVKSTMYITHESPPFGRWRFYYTHSPLFYTGDAFRLIEMNRDGVKRMLSRILRSTLFVHSILPDTVAGLEKNIHDLTSRVQHLDAEREEFFDQFGKRRIDKFHKSIQQQMTRYGQILEEFDRFREIERGIDPLLEFFMDPLEISLDDPAVHISEDAYQELIGGYQSLFHFDTPRLNHANDKYMVEYYIPIIRERVNKMHEQLKRYETKLAGSLELVESRRALFEGRRNMLLAIFLPALGACVVSICLFLWWAW